MYILQWKDPLPTSITKDIFNDEVLQTEIRVVLKDKVIKANYQEELPGRRSLESKIHEIHGEEDEATKVRRELFLRYEDSDLIKRLKVDAIHSHGYLGKGVKIGIFDSGIGDEAAS